MNNAYATQAVIMACTMAPAIVAQRTWVVDSSGAGDFTDFPPAVAAASPGDTIQLNHVAFPNRYTAATIDKGLTILQNGSWINLTDLIISNLSAGQVVVMYGWAGKFNIDFSDCDGHIHMNSCDGVDGLLPDGTTLTRARISNCALVTYNKGTLIDTRISSSCALFTDASLLGMRSADGRSSGPGLVMIDSDVRLANAGAWGSPSDPQVYDPPLAPGIRMQGGRLRLTGSRAVQGASICCDYSVYPPTRIPSPAIDSSGGEVIIDPAVPIAPFGGPTFAGDSTLRFDEMSWMTLQNVPRPSLADLNPKLYAPPGASAFICASLPFYPLDTPFGEFWLDPRPGMLVVIASGTVDSTGLFQDRNTLNALMLPGMATVWQGVVVDAGGIRVTTPVVPVRAL